MAAANKAADRHAPDQLAQIAATLLCGQVSAEPHHVKAAVASARLILDEAHGPLAEPEAEAEAEADAAAE